MRRLVAGRGFDLTLLGCAAAPAVVWAVAPGAGWMPLGLAIPPWIALALWGSRPAFRTRLDPAVALFLAAGAISLWAAYDGAAALVKFRLIVSAVLLYYALAYQPGDNLWTIAGALAGLGAMVSLPAVWSGVREVAGEGLGLSLASSDAYAGLMALTIPFALAVLLEGIRLNRRVLVVLGSVTMALMLAGLWASGDQSAWLGAGVALLLMIAAATPGSDSGPTRRPRLSHTVGFLLLLGAVTVVAVAAAWAAGVRWPDVLADTRVAERLALDRNTIRLAGDFLLTGGGLASFPGLYSRYVLLIPVLFTTSSHNLYLDVLTELGAAGLVSFTTLACGSVWLLRIRGLRPASVQDPAVRLPAAALGSVAALVVMGLIDDPLFATQGLGFLLLPFGMAAAVVGEQSWPRAERSAATVPGLPRAKATRCAWATAGAVLVLLLVSFHRQALSAGLANAGSVLLARDELRGWPTAHENGAVPSEARVLAAELFSRALALDPGNVSANYRLGLMAIDERDYVRARNPLQTALAEDPGHRGVRKALAYDLTWLGALDEAQPLLEGISEASQELGVYAWWWGTQGRDDLAERAARMSELLQP